MKLDLAKEVELAGIASKVWPQSIAYDQNEDITYVTDVSPSNAIYKFSVILKFIVIEKNISMLIKDKELYWSHGNTCQPCRRKKIGLESLEVESHFWLLHIVVWKGSK